MSTSMEQLEFIVTDYLNKADQRLRPLIEAGLELGYSLEDCQDVLSSVIVFNSDSGGNWAGAVALWQRVLTKAEEQAMCYDLQHIWRIIRLELEPAHIDDTLR